MANIFEFWAIDKDGQKYHEYIKTKSSRNSKVEKVISKKYNINIDDCLHFGMRQVDSD